MRVNTTINNVCYSCLFSSLTKRKKLNKVQRVIYTPLSWVRLFVRAFYGLTKCGRILVKCQAHQFWEQAKKLPYHFVGVQYVCIVCFLSGQLGKIFKLSLCKNVRQRRDKLRIIGTYARVSVPDSIKALFY
jgi:hypothetical protein